MIETYVQDRIECHHMKIDDTLVSIVLPVLNSAQYLEQSLRNCLNQSHRAVELIIVDGGSSDSTLEICRQYSDSRIRVIEQSDNRGKLPGALNLGFSMAKGDYLTWTHDDNLYATDAIARMVAQLESSPSVGMTYADYWLVSRELDPIRLVHVGPTHDLVYRNCIGPCFLYRKAVRDRIGDYDVSTFLQEDYDYWLRVTKAFPAVALSEPLYRYRVHDASLTGRNRRAMFDQFIRVRERHFDKQILPSKRQALAHWYMGWAFESYFARDYADAVTNALNALLRHPRFILNRGVRSIVMRSAIHSLNAARPK